MKNNFLKLLCLMILPLTFSCCHHSKNHIIKKAVTDIDGNTYDAVKIGNQIWMCGNLSVTRLNDSTQIGTDLFFKKHPYRCYYNTGLVKNDTTSTKLCPKGWHIPSKAEWETMIAAVEGNEKWMAKSGNAAVALTWAEEEKSKEEDEPLYNTSGFSALPGGFRIRRVHFPPTSAEDYMSELTRTGYYWSSTINEENMDPYAARIDAENGTVGLVKTATTYPIPQGHNGWPYIGSFYINCYMPIRCVKD